MLPSAKALNVRPPAVAQPVDSAAALSGERIAQAGFVLVAAALWMLVHPYEGLVHDSVLYAFAALARLHPDSLSHDIYLSVGVQDRYTLFSPLAAAVIQRAGLERGAALITLAAQLSFFLCSGLLARRLLARSEALLAVALLVVLPSQYGDGHIFSYAESFMTPRLPSEALVLCALAAAFSGRYLITTACLAAAALVHPIIASAGVALLFILYVALPRPGVAATLAAAGFCLIVAVAWLAPFGSVARFDTGWFHLLYGRGAYLFPSRWAVADWAHASVPLTTLAIGALTLRDSRIRSICIGALVLGASGLAMSLIGSDLLRIVLIAQVQPWRWLWLSNLLAVIFLPRVFASCWTTPDARRSAAILLAAAWVFIDEPYVPAIDVLAFLAVSAGRRVTDPRQVRLMISGAWTMLALGLVVLAQFVLRVVKQVDALPADRALYDSPYLLELRHWKSWQAGGVIPGCLVLAAWWAGQREAGRPRAFAVLALGIGLCVAFAHLAWNAWTRVDLPSRLYTEFAPWRAAIPQTAQVLWADDAFPTWYLLERPSYWSRSQTAASVYSEAMARELARREFVLHAIHESTHDGHELLVRTCQINSALGYYVVRANAGPTPYPLIKDPKGPGDLRLYRCADYRR